MPRFIFRYILLLGLFCISCLSTTKNSKGEYEYSYCLAVSGTNDEIVINERPITQDSSNLVIRTIDIHDNSPIPSVLRIKNSRQKNYDFENYISIDTLGFYSTTVPPDKYDIGFSYTGYNTINTSIDIKDKVKYLMTIKFGRSPAFVDFAIKSKRLLTKGQVKRRAIKLSKTY